MSVAFASVFDASRRLLAWLPLSIGLSFALPCAASPAHQQPVNNAKARKHTPAPKAAAKSHKSHRTQAHAAKATAADSYASRTDVMQWAHEAATRLDLPTDWVRQQIGQARRNPLIEQLVLPAPTPAAKNWAAYRSRFIEPRRIEAGVAFWQRHQATLARAEQTYGVPASIIVGIIGMETLYGQHMGNFRVIDALATLAFDFPQAHPRAAERKAFFLRELEQFLSLMQRTGQNPSAPRGSFAGAMGLPQFMPSSWVRYAIDFDGDGHVDLHASGGDAIGSVASYFIAHGWKPGMPTHYTVRLDGPAEHTEELLLPDILPTFSATRMQALGAQL